MTIQTPFANRPPTPFWSPLGPMGGGLAGLGDEQTAVRVLDAITAGAGAAERTLIYPYSGGVGPGVCPVGTVLNQQTWTCQPGGTVTASASSGVLILAAVGAVLFFMARGR